MSSNQARRQPRLTSVQIAELVGGELIGPSDLLVSEVEGLDAAGPGQVSFMDSAKYQSRLFPSRASVVLVPTDFRIEPPAGRAWVACEQPSAAFSLLVEYFAEIPPPPPPGIDPRAAVDSRVNLPTSVSVGPCAVIEAEVEVGENTVIGAGCYLGRGVRVGRDCQLYANVTVREFCRLGDRVVVHCGAAIGGDGFGFIPGRDGHRKIPQRGIVQIDDDVEIGALTAIDRARFGRTWIKRGAKLDNLVHIAHNVVVGEHCLIVAQVGVAGSARLGDHVMLGGQAGINGHIAIGDGAMVMGQSGVNKELSAGAKVGGSPAIPYRDYVRGQRNLARLEDLKQAIRRLQQEVVSWQQKSKE